MGEHSAESDALWIEAPREAKDRINEAIRTLEDALDDLTREATWAHLIKQIAVVRDEADRAVAAVAEAHRTTVTPPGSHETRGGAS